MRVDFPLVYPNCFCFDTGFMWFVGLSFNTVTAINMVLAVGIAVDYSAHIAHSFLVMNGSRKERAKGALHHIGGEVLAGASQLGLRLPSWVLQSITYSKHSSRCSLRLLLQEFGMAWWCCRSC